MSLTIPNARSLALATLCLSLAACSGGGSNSRLDYKEAKTLPSLEVPPELATPIDTGTETIPEVAADGKVTQSNSGVLPVAEGIRIERDGSTRWLVVDASAEELWPRLRQFWAGLGLEVKMEEPRIGIMETQWAENRADAPGGFLADLVKSVFKNAYAADTRDKYRLRLEPVGENRTELFVSHYGLKEVVAAQTESFVETAWNVRPSDPELANEILNRLAIYLGGSRQIAEAVRTAEPVQQSTRVRLDGDTLVLNEGFSRAWRLTGLALDRIGLVVQDRNRSAGIYYVSRVDLLADAGVDGEDGWFSSLFASGDEEQAGQKQWQIHMSGGETSTRIRVRDDKGAEVPQQASRRILQKLQESLR